MRTRAYVFCLALTGVLFGNGFAQTPSLEKASAEKASPRESALYFMTPAFHTLDCEGVGAFDEGHVEEHGPQIFFQYDRDRNRKITESEFVSRWKDDRASLRVAIYTEMDLDKNKAVTPNELRAYALKATKLLDTDHDGEVTLAEMNMKLTTPQSRSNTKTDSTEAAGSHMKVGLPPRAERPSGP